MVIKIDDTLMKSTTVNMLCNLSMRQCNTGPVTKNTIKTSTEFKFLQMIVESSIVLNTNEIPSTESGGAV